MVKRRTPEEYLELMRREKQGSLKIFVGSAPGVGKTYAMLREGNEMYKKGIDIVIGLIETHGREATKEQIGELPVIPLKKVDYQGKVLEEMDVESVLKRHPKYVIIDELAHTNVPGSRNPKRYEDVLEIMAAGIHVITAMNIQHLESLNNTIEQLTGGKGKGAGAGFYSKSSE